MDLTFIYFILFLFSRHRFRRERHAADVEKGDSKDSKDTESSHTKKPSSGEESSAPRPRASKWGRLLGNFSSYI